MKQKTKQLFYFQFIVFLLLTITISCNNNNDTDKECSIGDNETRIRYEDSSGYSCQSENQTRSCVNQKWGNWDGTFSHEQCSITPPISFDNSPFAINCAFKRTFFLRSFEEQKEFVTEQAKLLQDIGVKWERGPSYFSSREAIENDDGKFDFSNTDAILKILKEHDIIKLWQFKHFKSKETDSDPISADELSNYIKKVVERYDGDNDYGCTKSSPDCYETGDNQYPASDFNIILKHWEIGNEPDLVAYFKDSPETYFNFLQIAHEAIKSSDSQAQILLSGMSNFNEFVAPDGVFMSSTSYAYFDALSELGVNNKFDIMNYHDYNRDFVLMKEVYSHWDQEVDKPIWITELGMQSQTVGVQPWLKGDPRSQAGWVLKGFASSLANGVKKIFWHTFNDVEYDSEGKLASADNIYDPMTKIKKLSYYTYKLMTEKLIDSDWDNIQTIQETTDIHIYKFINKETNKPIWVAWNNNSNEQSISLNVDNFSSVKIIEVIPNYKRPEDVPNYDTAFTSVVKSVSNQMVSVTLKDSPVFIEEIEISTKCEIKTNSCPNHSEMVFPYDDAWNDSNIDKDKCLARASDFYYWCGESDPVTATFKHGEDNSSITFPGTCKIETQSCPNYPEVVFPYNDSWNGSNLSNESCMARASDFYYWCGGSEPVTATFEDGVNDSSTTFPVTCKIETQSCPNYPEVVFPYNDSYEGSNLDKNKCLARASDFYYWCGESAQVKATFMDGKDNSSITFPGTCKIETQSCPNNPEVVFPYNDSWNGSNLSKESCTARASDFYYWCGESAPVRATFTDGINHSSISFPGICKIETQSCPNYPEVVFPYNDSWNGSNLNKESCMTRAADYYYWCGESDSVRATFLDGVNFSTTSFPE